MWTFHLTAYADNLAAHKDTKSLVVHKALQLMRIKPYEIGRLGAQQGFEHFN